MITVAGGAVIADAGKKKGIASGKPLTLAVLREMALEQITAKE